MVQKCSENVYTLIWHTRIETKVGSSQGPLKQLGKSFLQLLLKAKLHSEKFAYTG